MKNLICAAALCFTLGLGPAPAHATTFFTDFSGLNGEDPNQFAIGPAAFSASDPNNIGATFGPLGVPELYSSNPNAWVIGPGGSLEISFSQTVTDLSFFAIGLDGATVTILGNVVGSNIIDVTGADIKLSSPLSFSGAISGLILQNTSGLPNVGNFAVYGASIDDLEFTAIPEPAALSLMAMCLLAMGLIWARTAPAFNSKRA